MSRLPQDLSQNNQCQVECAMTQDVTTCIPTQPPYSSKPLSPSPPSSPMSILSSSPSKSRCSRQSVRFADMPADISPRVPNTHKQRAPISPLKSATVQPVVATQPPSPYLDILETLLTRAPSCTARDNYVTPKRREHRAASSSSTTDSERSNGQRQAFSLQPPSTVSEKPIGESLFMIDCSDLPPLPRRRAGDPPTRQRFEFPSQEQLIDEINHKAMVVAQQRKAKRATTALLDTPKNGPQAYASTTGSHKEANNKGVTGTSWIDVQGVPSEDAHDDHPALALAPPSTKKYITSLIAPALTAIAPQPTEAEIRAATDHVSQGKRLVPSREDLQRVLPQGISSPPVHRRAVPGPHRW